MYIEVVGGLVSKIKGGEGEVHPKSPIPRILACACKQLVMVVEVVRRLG